MYKKMLLSILLVGSLSLISAPKKLSLEERINKRFELVLKKCSSYIQKIEAAFGALKEKFESNVAELEKENLSEEYKKQIQENLAQIIKDMSDADLSYSKQIAELTTRLKADKITKAEIEDITQLFIQEFEVYHTTIQEFINRLTILTQNDTNLNTAVLANPVL